MKALLTFVLVALLSASFAVAAPADKKKKPAKVGGVFAKLDLSEQQTAQIAEIQAAAKEAAKAAGDDKDARRKVNAATKEKIMAVLTPEQREKLAKLQSEAKGQPKKKDGDAPKKKDGDAPKKNKKKPADDKQ